MEFTKTQKGRDVIVYGGFEYLSFRTVNGTTTWRCRLNRTTNCHSTMKTTGIHPRVDVTSQPTNHCHDACPQNAAANILLSNMKDDMKAVNATPRQVIGAQLVGVPNEILAHIPKNSSLSRTLKNQHSRGQDANPRSADFVIPEKYRHFVLHDTGIEDENRILLLGNRILVDELKNKDTLYGDGTFDKVPNMFYQLYTLHASVGTSYPPLVYVLLQRKDTNTYRRMFQLIKQLVPELNPSRVLVDFEKACMNAAATEFPEAQIKGCYFHLTQSLIRKISNVGLKQDYQADIQARMKLKSLAALSFVPEQHVRETFNVLAATFPDEDRYNEVLQYFLGTYVEGISGRNPMFPIAVWNHYQAALEAEPRTTNCCEGFHNALNAIFHCSHPSVWTLFDGLVKDAAFHRLTLVKAQSGQFETRKRKYVTLSESVSAAVRDYGELDRLTYLRRLSYLQ